MRRLPSLRASLRARLAATMLALLPVLPALPAGAATPPSDLGQVAGAVVKPLPLYAHPGDAAAAQSVAPDNLPWPVLESKDDFYRVRVAGHDYWVDSMTVRVTRGAKASCAGTVMQGGSNHSPTGSTPGAGEANCR